MITMVKTKVQPAKDPMMIKAILASSVKGCTVVVVACVVGGSAGYGRLPVSRSRNGLAEMLEHRYVSFHAYNMMVVVVVGLYSATV